MRCLQREVRRGREVAAVRTRHVECLYLTYGDVACGAVSPRAHLRWPEAAGNLIQVAQRSDRRRNRRRRLLCCGQISAWSRRPRVLAGAMQQRVCAKRPQGQNQKTEHNARPLEPEMSTAALPRPAELDDTFIHGFSRIVRQTAVATTDRTSRSAHTSVSEAPPWQKLPARRGPQDRAAPAHPQACWNT